MIGFRRKIALLICPELRADPRIPCRETVGFRVAVHVVPADLVALVELFATHKGRSEATISNKAAGNATLFERLRTGKGCNIRTAQKVLDWFSDNWPVDLQWPADVPRPSAKKDAA